MRSSVKSDMTDFTPRDKFRIRYIYSEGRMHPNPSCFSWQLEDLLSFNIHVSYLNLGTFLASVGFSADNC